MLTNTYLLLNCEPVDIVLRCSGAVLSCGTM